MREHTMVPQKTHEQYSLTRALWPGMYDEERHLAPFHCLSTMQRLHSDILQFESCPCGEPPTKSNGRAKVYAATIAVSM